MSVNQYCCSEQDLEYLKRFRLMDDDFMSKVFENNIEATQLLLNIILQRDDLKVASVQIQREIKSVVGHSVKFDVFAKDEDDKPYDIEIQRSDRGASPQRARYNSAMLDANLLCKGKDYSKLSESYIIFITENDVIGRGCPIYRIEREILETNDLFNDGSHIIFVNGQYRANDAIGKLMHDFNCTDAKDMYYPILAEKVKYFKETEGGNAAMCKMMEDMRNEAATKAATQAAIENAKRMLNDKLSLEKVSEYSGLSLEEIKEIHEKLTSA